MCTPVYRQASACVDRLPPNLCGHPNLLSNRLRANYFDGFGRRHSPAVPRKLRSFSWSAAGPTTIRFSVRSSALLQFQLRTICSEPPCGYIPRLLGVFTTPGFADFLSCASRPSKSSLLYRPSLIYAQSRPIPAPRAVEDTCKVIPDNN